MSIFLDNKYTKWYFQIIESRLIQPSNEEYSEIHHIIPRSIEPKLINDSNNCVKLTAREHFVVHQLLTKMMKSKQHEIKMLYALGMFTTRNLTSRRYDLAKRACSSRMKAKWQDPEYSSKMSKMSSEKGKNRNISQILKDRNDGSYEAFCESISNSLIGKSKSESHKQAISDSAKTRKRTYGIPRTLSYKWINKDGKNKRVKDPSNLLNDGWVLGRS